MAVSGKTAAPIEAPYALSSDKPTDVPTLTKAMAEREHALLEERDAKIQAGGVAVHRLTELETERTSETLGSLSIPLAVTLPNVLPGQLVEAFVFGYGEGTFALAMGPTYAGSAINVSEKEGSNRYQIYTGDGGALMKSATRAPQGNLSGTVVLPETAWVPARYVVPTPIAGFVVELQARKNSGTSSAAKMKYGYIMARVSG